MDELSNEDLVRKILDLKSKKNAVVLAHNYQRSEIFEVADFTGDSLGLCIEASKVKADIIIFAGVHFMAETAVILNPDKKVYLPVLDAGCAMSDMIDIDALRKKKSELLATYPDLKVVAYVNTSALVKSEADICCTSSNAVKIVESLDSRNILFVPDKNLAKFVQNHLPDKNIIPWEGFCPIHHRITKEYLEIAKRAHPKAMVIAHPECRDEVVQMADYVCSTSNMIEAVVKEEKCDEFIIITECGMLGRLKAQVKHKKFFTVCNMCFDMKKTTLLSIYESLLYDRFLISVPEDIRLKAKTSLELMLTNS